MLHSPTERIPRRQGFDRRFIVHPGTESGSHRGAWVLNKRDCLVIELTSVQRSR